jgi:hypothetical protein
MDRDTQNPPTTGQATDQLEKLRLLVTLQNQIVEQARRNRQAQQDCAELSERIAREIIRREPGRMARLIQHLRRAGSLARWSWLASAAVRKNGIGPVPTDNGFSNGSPGELTVAKPARNR